MSHCLQTDLPDASGAGRATPSSQSCSHRPSRSEAPALGCICPGALYPPRALLNPKNTSCTLGLRAHVCESSSLPYHTLERQGNGQVWLRPEHSVARLVWKVQLLLWAGEASCTFGPAGLGPAFFSPVRTRTRGLLPSALPRPAGGGGPSTPAEPKSEWDHIPHVLSLC